LTTYRLMAERGVDLAVQRLNERFHYQAAKGLRTKELVVAGGEISRHEIRAKAQQFAEQKGVNIETAHHLLNAYGSEARRVIEIAKEDDRLSQAIINGLPHILAEVAYAVRYEMAITIADVLARRTRLIILAGKASLDCAPVVAELMAKELRWNKNEIENQLAQFAMEYEGEYVACRL
jgi:glycerol-3-phosphate dehydrogenase